MLRLAILATDSARDYFDMTGILKQDWNVSEDHLEWTFEARFAPNVPVDSDDRFYIGFGDDSLKYWPSFGFSGLTSDWQTFTYRNWPKKYTTDAKLYVGANKAIEPTRIEIRNIKPATGTPNAFNIDLTNSDGHEYVASGASIFKD